MVLHLAAEMQRSGNSVCVLCIHNRGDLADEATAAGIELHSVASVRGYDVGALWRIIRELKSFKPDVINAHDRSSLPYLILANSLSTRRPIVFSGHGLLGQDVQPRLRDRWSGKCVSAVTAVSHPAAKEYARLFRWTREVEIINNGVPPVERNNLLRQETRSRLGVDQDTFGYLAVGNIKPEKGFEDLLDAASILRSQTSRARFVIFIAGGVSDHAYHANLLAQHRSLKLNGTVTFLGSRSDMPALYSAADAFVLSSRKEGLPMVLLEAMSAGLPVVATAVGAVPEVIRHGQEGLVTDAASPQALAAAMKQLLDSPELRTSLSQAGKLRVTTQYSVAAMADHYLKVYRDCIAKSK